MEIEWDHFVTIERAVQEAVTEKVKNIFPKPTSHGLWKNWATAQEVVYNVMAITLNLLKTFLKTGL